LEAMAAGGEGRFLFASARLHPDYDAASSLHASQAPGAFALTPDPKHDPLSEAVEAIEPDQLSPREALEKLYELKRLARSGE